MSDKIYHLLETILNKKTKEVSSKGKNYSVILSFEKISEREEFISNNKDLEIVKKFNVIPSISVKLNESQILKFSKDELVRQIEEDQQVFLSLLEINDIFELSRVKHSQISYTGKNITVGIIDDGVNNNFSSVSNVSRYSVQGSTTSFKMNEHTISHGTVMASIIGNQIRDTEDMVIGIAPDVNLLDFEISGSTEEYYFSNILEIFDMIIHNNIQVDVLLISLITNQPSDGLDLLSLACDVLS
ncbi:MAG: S8 family serine peptidase, partial [Promethearchaeota archaeon]